MVRILEVFGGSLAGGGFASGDPLEVRFVVEKDDGSPWGLGEMTFSSALVSGPTFSYQRVIAEQNDVAARARKNPDGSYSYRFAAPLPATYLAPYNDTPTFGALEGELTGQPLLAGTYTVGLGFAWSYTLDGTPAVDAGEATFDFLFGAPAALAPRQVVAQDNCNLCHVQLEAHGGLRRTVDMCVLCHTAGAEDLNDPAILGGSPGVSVDSRVLFHKLHNASRLPSALGIGVDAAGVLRYDLPPVPYQVVAGDGTVVDYSGVDFPVFPQRAMPMPRDVGYAGLTQAAQAQEDAWRSGVSACFVCHGDPDGAGPLGAPLNGDLIWSQPLQASCGSCHDDVDFTRNYQTNFQTMPPQANNGDCRLCHPVDLSPLAVRDGHRHPLDDPFTAPGLNVLLTAIVESGAHDGDGTIDVGEGIAVTFELRDDAGAAIGPGQTDSIRALVSGPTTNRHLLLDVEVPAAALTGPQPFTLDLPERIDFEHLGDSTAAGGEVFVTSRAPHVAGTSTSVFVRTGLGAGSSVLTARGDPGENFVDVANAAGFARDDVLVLSDGTAAEEYLRVQHVDGNRLWFSSIATSGYPRALRGLHGIGTAVDEVTLAPKAAGVDYALDPPTGTLTELIELGTGAVLVDYTGPFQLPATYPGALHDSPNLAAEVGEWRAQPLVDGTYSVSVSAHRDITANVFGELTPYDEASPAAALDFLVGAATSPDPYSLLSSVDNCKSCHQDVWYHDGTYRGFETCVACHGTPGAEDLPPYVAPNAPDTTGATVGLRGLLHAIHMGAEIEDPSALQRVARGPAPHPNNFSVRDLSGAHFPAQPGASAECAACHGDGNTAWHQPAVRDHPTPTAPLAPVQAWRAACAGCHNGPASAAHMDVNTSPSGVESCAICHGPGDRYAVDRVHRQR